MADHRLNYAGNTEDTLVFEPSTTNFYKHPDVQRAWAKWSEDQTLHVVVPYSNYFRWRTRRELVNDCIRHLESMPNLDVHVVEVSYGDRPFEVTGGRNNDVQLRTKDSEIWLKEQTINLGVARFPAGWKYGAYVDGDFTFTRHDVGLETIHQLQTYQFAQMFSSYADLTGQTYGTGHRPIRVNNGFAYNYIQNGYQLPAGYINGGWKKAGMEDEYYAAMGGKLGVGATGGAWAWRREAFDAVGGMLDICALGHGDWFMTFGLVGEDAPDMHISGYHKDYKDAIYAWQQNAAKLKKNVGYVDAFCTHHFHGPKSRRGYSSRDKILVKHQFSPVTDLKRDWQGLYYLTPDKPGLRDDLRRYFISRGEDPGYTPEQST